MPEDPVCTPTYQLNRYIEIERRTLYDHCKQTFNLVRITGQAEGETPRTLRPSEWGDFKGVVTFLFENLDGETATCMMNKVPWTEMLLRETEVACPECGAKKKTPDHWNFHNFYCSQYVERS